jgi:hypothetical protein
MVEVDHWLTGKPATAERRQRSKATDPCQTYHLGIDGPDSPHVSGDECPA